MTRVILNERSEVKNPLRRYVKRRSLEKKVSYNLDLKPKRRPSREPPQGLFGL